MFTFLLGARASCPQRRDAGGTPALPGCHPRCEQLLRQHIGRRNNDNFIATRKQRRHSIDGERVMGRFALYGA